jgi:hypothetical protein
MNTITHYIDKTILKQVRNLLDVVINNYDKIILQQDDKKSVEKEEEQYPWPGNDYY